MFKGTNQPYAEDPKSNMLYGEIGRALCVVVFLVLLGIVIYFLAGE